MESTKDGMTDTAIEEPETQGNVGLIVLIICGLLIFFVIILFVVIWYIKRARRRWEQEEYKRNGDMIQSTTNGMSTISQQMNQPHASQGTQQNSNGNAKRADMQKKDDDDGDSDNDVIQGMQQTAGGDMQTKQDNEEESYTDSDYDSQAPKKKHDAAESSTLQFDYQDTITI